MVTPKASPIYNIRLSSVGPGHVTGPDAVHQPGPMDLSTKLHYIKGVYLFSSQAARGINTAEIKNSMFSLLDEYYVTCGRLRRSESGRPYIKCNDCGARFVEAECDMTVEEWLGMEDYAAASNDLLIYHKPIGPELSFSPLVYLQLTRFKCGGISLSLSWAHILGDAFSASHFMERLGHHMAGGPKLNDLPKIAKRPSQNPKSNNLVHQLPFTIKKVDPVGDHWLTPNNCKMETFSLHISPAQLSNISRQNQNHFESLCAIIWQSIAKIRGDFEPQVVTVCKKGILNTQIICNVEADFAVKEAELTKLVELLLVEQDKDERSKIEAAVEKENGMSDFILYGARLTFVNLDDLNQLELNGQKPVKVLYYLQGVGDEGAVVVLPAGPGDSSGRIVTLTLPEDEALKLRMEFKKSGLILHDTQLE